MKNNQYVLQEITPASLKCVVGACPAIYQTNHNTYLIIGSVVANNSNRMAYGQESIEIPKKLIEETYQLEK